MDTIPQTTLADAKAAYWKTARAEGGKCECCGRFGKVYRRPISKSMVKALVLFYRMRKPYERKDGGYRDHKDVLPPELRHDYGLLKHWKLLEQAPNDDPTRKASGLWRITLDGKGFLKGMHKVPKYSVVYNDELIELEGPKVGPAECLRGEPFNFEEMMDEQVEPLQPGQEAQLDLLQAAG